MIPVVLNQIRRRLRNSATDAHRFAIHPYETRSRDLVKGELLPKTLALVDRAIEAVEIVWHRYRARGSVVTAKGLDGSERSDAFALVFEDAVGRWDAPDPRDAVVRATALGRLELSALRGALDRVSSKEDRWSMVCECASARNRVIRIAGGLERMLVRVEGLPPLPEVGYQTETLRAISVRTLLYHLSRSLRDNEAPVVAERVREASAAIANVITSKAYQDLRMNDRKWIRVYQARLWRWLRGPRSSKEGRELLDGLERTARRSLAVNQRRVLVEHDKRVLFRVREALDAPVPDECEVYRWLMTTVGRDPRLDDMISSFEPLVVRRWAPQIERVLGRLGAGRHLSVVAHG